MQPKSPNVRKKERVKISNEIQDNIIEFDNFRKSDYKRLQRAIKNFNQKRNYLIKKEKELDKEQRYIEKTIEKESYREMKKQIKTREQLNFYIKNLREFSKRGMENIDIRHQKETGQSISKWQKKIINRNIKNAKSRLSKRLEEYKEEIENAGGLSKYDMKNTEAISIENQIEALENYKLKRTGFEFREKIRSLKKQGSLDYELKRSYNYMVNYIEVMEKYAGRPYYYEFMKVLKSFSSPFAFYEKIKNDELRK